MTTTQKPAANQPPLLDGRPMTLGEKRMRIDEIGVRTHPDLQNSVVSKMHHIKRTVASLIDLVNTDVVDPRLAADASSFLERGAEIAVKSVTAKYSAASNASPAAAPPTTNITLYGSAGTGSVAYVGTGAIADTTAQLEAVTQASTAPTEQHERIIDRLLSKTVAANDQEPLKDKPAAPAGDATDTEKAAEATE